MEKRFYLVNLEEGLGNDFYWDWSDKKFMRIAEEQGNVYSEKGFVSAFNNDEFSSLSCALRIIEVPTHENRI